MLASNLKGYKLIFTKSAERDIDKINEKNRKNILSKLEMLVSGGKNLDTKKMQDESNTYRLRCGDYRVVYKVKNKEIVVLVIKVGHRREIYKRMKR